MKPSLGKIEDAFRKQADYCRKREASFTASILEAVAKNLSAEGALAPFFDHWTDKPLRSALPLRFAAGMHWLALAGKAGALGDIYGDMSKDRDVSSLEPLIIDAACSNKETVLEYFSRPVQTNEPRRAAALLPGFTAIAAHFSMPMDIYEIGASCGLLLNWDKYRIDFGSVQWGEGDYVIPSEWRGEQPSFPSMTVLHRRGCDLHPLDLTDDAHLMRARSYLWPEQQQRVDLFDGAAEITRQSDIELQKADAGEWLERVLSNRASDRVAVVYQSVFENYLSEEQIAGIRSVIEKHAQAANDKVPLAWLRFEPEDTQDGFEFFVDVCMWPGGEWRRIARCHPHGNWVEGLAEPA